MTVAAVHDKLTASTYTCKIQGIDITWNIPTSNPVSPVARNQQRRVLLNVISRPLRPVVLVPRDIGSENLVELTKWLCSLWGGDHATLIPFSRGLPVPGDYLALAERADPDCAVVAGAFQEYKDEPAVKSLERIGMRWSSEVRFWSPDATTRLDRAWKDPATRAPAIHRYLSRRFQDVFYQSPSALLLLEYAADHRLAPYYAYSYGAAPPQLRAYLEERLRPVTQQTRRMGPISYLARLTQSARQITLPLLTRQGLTTRWPTIQAESIEQVFTQTRNHCSVVIANESNAIDGFCLSWTLRRCHRYPEPLFLPKAAVTHTANRDALHTLINDVLSDCDSLHVYAPNTSRRAARTLAAKCSEAFNWDNVTVRYAEWGRGLVRGITHVREERIMESEVRDNVASFALPAFLDLGRGTPRSKFPPRDLAAWGIEVEVHGLQDTRDGYMIPPRPEYQGRIGLTVPTRDKALGGARVTPSGFTFRTDRPDVVARMQLSSAHSLLQPLAGPRRIIAGTTDASRRFEHAVDLFGGLDALGDLYHEGVRDLVEDLVPQLRGGNPDVAGRKPSTDLAKLMNRLGNKKVEHRRLRGVIQYWLKRGVLIRAFSVTCQECGYSDLYDLEDVGNFFMCRGCRGSIPLPLNSETHVRFSEVIHRTLVEGGYAAVMALLRFRSFADRSFFWTAAVSLKNKDTNDETDSDLVCFIDGACCLAESKTLLRGASHKTLTEVRRQCERLYEMGTAIGVDCVALATLLAPKGREVQALRKWARRRERKHGPTLRVLHQGDLFGTRSMETSNLGQLVTPGHTPDKGVLRVGELVGNF